MYFPDYAPMAEFSITRLYYMIKQWDYNCRIARVDGEPIYDLGRLGYSPPIMELINR